LILKNFILVFLGGGVGSMVRYALGLLIHPQNSFIPIHTLSANIAACFLLGITIGYFQYHKNMDPQLLLLVATGFCGGLSTFSTFVGDSYQLVDSTKNYIKLMVNIIVNLIGCFVLFWSGLTLVKTLN